MSDNISDKLAEAITTIIKKTNAYEKAHKAEHILKGVAFFMLFTSAISLFNYFTLNTIYAKNIDQSIQQKLDNEFHFLNHKIDKLQEDNEKIIVLLERQYSLKLNTLPSIQWDKETISKNSSENFKPLDTELKEDPDNELLNECYDIMPCNNSTKVHGMNSLFNWK